ncbi:LOB domain-containing protein 37-like [Bidens hawaiensis]|uniref:LOB domain-containing protein 37-like n=1 Tax=Bidens hawaiensis TaxID=980011 RepID=UPI0040493D83
MSCNGCRVLRKGCNENCILRQSLTAIESAQAQANATVFVAKFFGRAGLLSFLSAVPEYQRPALFQSLLFEACGRTVNPVNGAVGLLWTGNWHLCQSAVATVLRGGNIRAMPELFSAAPTTVNDNASEAKASLIPDGIELGLSSGGDGSSDPWTSTKRKRTASLEVSETTTLESGTDSACSETKLRLFI